MKIAFLARGLPVGPYRVLLAFEWHEARDVHAQAIGQALGFPVFVKPANLGSSVGISKAKTHEDLLAAIDLAFAFDRKAVIEAAVPAAREIEVGVLGNERPEASVAGEIIPSREFYDYEAKYLDEGSVPVIPADLPPATSDEIRRLAIEAFKAVDGSGLARVDFLLSRETGQLFVNEVNTLPGFTTISMYSKLWAASGVDYPVLLDRLVTLARERHAAKQHLKTSAV
jgi:D-alanine-D-alanine ligase